jgi:hypothetical protein
MFKKIKERLAEVGEEVKKDPRFANSLASVNQLAQQVSKTLLCVVNLIFNLKSVQFVNQAYNKAFWALHNNIFSLV